MSRMIAAKQQQPPPPQNRKWGAPKSIKLNGEENVNRDVCTCDRAAEAYRINCFLYNYKQFCDARKIHVPNMVNLAATNTLRELSMLLSSHDQQKCTSTLMKTSETEIMRTFIGDYAVAHPSFTSDWSDMHRLNANSNFLKQL